MIIATSLLASVLATAAPKPCSFNEPLAGVTQLEAERYGLCATVSSVHETEGQALDGALEAVQKRAATLCGDGTIRNIGQPQVSLVVATQVTVRQVVVCDRG